MAQSIVFNNATYIIPDVGESNWGQNLTNFFVAIPQGCYQLSGGTAPLTADLSFGSSFGIFAKYLTSVTSTPATAGAVRLARADSIEWRNQLNNANLALAVDSSNNLLWNGDIIATASASPVLSITGTANQIIASSATGNVTLSTPQDIGTGSGPTFDHITLAKTTNQIILGTTNTTTIDSVAPSASRVYTIPDAGGAANIVLDAGNYTIAGTWTFSNALTITPTTNQLVLGTTRTITLSATQPASSSRVYTFPDAGAAANVVLDQGNYTIAGTWSFSNSITLASSKAIILTDNSTNTVTLKATNSTTSWTLSLPTTHGSSGQFLQTDGSGNTSWQAGGSGTVVSSTAGNLALYPSSSNSVSDTYVQNTHNITLGIASQGSRSANLTMTIPNPGNAITAANVVLDQGAYTIAGAWTHTATLTMSGATIAMGSQKITGLANGTAATDAAAFGQLASQVATNAGLPRNRIVNGEMLFDQRKEGSAYTANGTPTSQYTLDMVKAFNNQSGQGVFTIQQLTTTPPTGFQNYVRFKTTTADASIASTDVYSFELITEGCMTRDFLFGTASAQTVTLSFWARSSLTGTFGGCIQNAGGVRCYVFNYTIAAANTWTYCTVTAAGDTSGTWTTAQGVLGLNIGFDLGSGSSFQGVVNTWNAFDSFTTSGATQLIGTVNATLDFTGFQLEIGPNATAFEYRSYDDYLRLCQRYFSKTYEIGTAVGTVTSTNLSSITAAIESTNLPGSGLIMRYPVKMSFIPTLKLYAADGTADKWLWYTAAGVSTLRTSLTNNAGTYGFEIYQSTTSTELYANGHWYAECAF